jgi:hypothetical protein
MRQHLLGRIERIRAQLGKPPRFGGFAHDLYGLCALYSSYFPANGIISAQPSLEIYGILACRHDGCAAIRSVRHLLIKGILA